MDRPPISLGELSYRPAGKTYTLREAQTIRELDEVHRITHDSIVEAGYMPPQCGGRIISYPELDPSPLTTILVAVEEGRVIGTNSITGDGPFGLPTDRHFKAETDAIRAEGRRLLSSFRIATDPHWSARCSPALVMDMLKWSYFVAWKQYDFETILCTFNPKHEGVYARLLAARTVKFLDVMEGDHISAGAVLMRIARERTPAAFVAEMEQIEASMTTGSALGGFGQTIAPSLA